MAIPGARARKRVRSLAPLIPNLAVLACGFLMLNLPLATWLRFAAWMALGLAVYGLYGYRHSRLATTG